MNANPASMYQIRKGETFGVVAFSNAAVTLIGRMRVVYNSGKKDEFILNETASGSSRAAVLATCGQHVAEEDGVVVDMWAASSGTVLQRGQLYLQAGLASDPGFTTITVLLGQGYRYQNVSVVLGQFVEAGPAGGHGFLQSQATDNPAAGVQHAAITVPAGVLHRYSAYREVVAAFTAAAKSVIIRNGGSSTGIMAASATFTPAAAAGLIQSYQAAGNSLDTVANAITFAFATTLLVAGDTVLVTLNGIAGGDDLAAGVFTIEEWVMPN